MKNKQILIVLSVLVLVASLFGVVACDTTANDEVKVTVTNKDQLTAAWTEGDADRQLAVEITVGGKVVTDKTYSVSSDNSAVVSVADDNTTLKAVGGGKAKITVKVDDVTDTVEITVTPSLKSVAITNKTALTDVWTVGDAARKLEVKFNPDYYQTNKPEYTVVSSDPTVVEVGADKATLTAKKLGEATVTVTAGKYSDSVKLSVRPALESVTIANKAALAEAWTDWTQTRTVEVTFAPAEYYTADNTTATVTVDPTTAIKVEGYTLTAQETGNVTVTVSVAGKTDSFTVEIQRSVPQITFGDAPGFEPTDDGGMTYSLENTSVALPSFSARACDGKSITDIQAVASEGAQYDEEKNTLTAPKGTYTLTITACDPMDATKKTTKTITVTFARKVFAWQDGSWTLTNEYVADSEQTAANSVSGIQLASFNMDPSTYYYAEVTFTGASRFIGLANFMQTTDGENRSRFLVSAVQPGDNNYQNIDYDTTLSWVDGEQEHSGWELIGSEWNDLDYGANYFFHSYRLSEYLGLKENENKAVHKIAMLRMGDYFVTFWNDQYVNSVTLRHYAEDASRPGLFLGFGDDTKAGEDAGILSSMSYFGGEQAVKEKYNALTDNGAKLIKAYAPDSWATGSRDNASKITRNATTDNGLSFAYDGSAIGDDGNSSMISTYQLFDGDFSFSWKYKNISEGGNWEPRSALEVRSYKYDAERLVVGAQYGNGGSTDNAPRWLINTPNYEAEQWFEGQANFDTTMTLKFTVTRHITETASEYTVTIQSVENPSLTLTRTIRVTAAEDDRWDKAVIMHWKNAGVNGVYSDVMWKNFNGQGNWVD